MLASEVGFEQISVSYDVEALIKFVSRAETTLADAYLTPVLTRYIDRLQHELTAVGGPRLSGGRCGRQRRDIAVRDRRPVRCAGCAGKTGRNRLQRVSGETEELAATAAVHLEAGNCLVIETPGGGGYGTKPTP